MKKIISVSLLLLFVTSVCIAADIIVTTKQLNKKLGNLTAQVSYPHVSGLKTEVGNKINALFLNNINAELKKVAKTSENPMTLSIGFTLRTSKHNILSITTYLEGYMEKMAHPWHRIDAYNFTASTGKSISFKELWKGRDRTVLNGMVKKYITAKYGDNEFGQVSEKQNFYLTDDSLVIFFNEYEIGPYVMGQPEAVIKLSNLKNMLDPKGPLGFAAK